MQLSKLKEELIERNIQLPENKRRISSVRTSYKNGLIQKMVKKEQPIIKVEPKLENLEKDPTVYQHSSELLGLSVINETTSHDELSISNQSIDDNSKIDSIKVIGITGSCGKSTTAFLVHEYIKSLGYKSVLYSSIRIDSPASYINTNEPCEIPLRDEKMLLDIIEEAEAYQADYIVMECNESAIEKGLTQDIPFIIRALTNIIPTHNSDHYTPQEYVALKKSFFENIPTAEECTCIFGMTGPFTREEFNDLLRLNSHPKITYGSKYVCERRNADYTNIDYLLYADPSQALDSLNGLNMKMRVKTTSHNFETSVILPHNALNFTCAVAILDTLGIFEPQAFQKCIQSIQIPGREEVIKVNGRTIVIGLSLVPALGAFKRYKNNGEIGQVKVIIGSRGIGYVSWEDKYIREQIPNERSIARMLAMNYLKANADYAYITSNDNAADNPLQIAEELQGYLNNEIPSVIEVDRKKAIRKALTESQPNDLIYIAGRGNRRIFCDTANTIKLFQDKEVVQDVIKELRW